jgi:hypothetical protein
MPSFVLAFRLSGESHPAAFPSGTSVVDFRHDGAGGTVTLYEFTDAEAAGQFAELVEGSTFSGKREAARAFEEATDAY